MLKKEHIHARSDNQGKIRISTPVQNLGYTDIFSTDVQEITFLILTITVDTTQASQHTCGDQIQDLLIGPVHEKTNNLHRRKQRRRSASR